LATVVKVMERDRNKRKTRKVKRPWHCCVKVIRFFFLNIFL
jgi:hypothetical protein